MNLIIDQSLLRIEESLSTITTQKTFSQMAVINHEINPSKGKETPWCCSRNVIPVTTPIALFQIHVEIIPESWHIVQQSFVLLLPHSFYKWVEVPVISYNSINTPFALLGCKKAILRPSKAMGVSFIKRTPFSFRICSIPSISSTSKQR